MIQRCAEGKGSLRKPRLLLRQFPRWVRFEVPAATHKLTHRHTHARMKRKHNFHDSLPILLVCFLHFTMCPSAFVYYPLFAAILQVWLYVCFTDKKKEIQGQAASYAVNARCEAGPPHPSPPCYLPYLGQSKEQEERAQNAHTSEYLTNIPTKRWQDGKTHVKEYTKTRPKSCGPTSTSLFTSFGPQAKH